MFTLWLISKAASALDFVRRYLYVKKHRPNKSCFVDKLKKVSAGCRFNFVSYVKNIILS